MDRLPICWLDRLLRRVFWLLPLLKSWSTPCHLSAPCVRRRKEACSKGSYPVSGPSASYCTLIDQDKECVQDSRLHHLCCHTRPTVALEGTREHVTLGLVIQQSLQPSALPSRPSTVLDTPRYPHSTPGSQTCQVTLVSGNAGLAPTDVPNLTVLNGHTSPPMMLPWMTPLPPRVLSFIPPRSFAPPLLLALFPPLFASSHSLVHTTCLPCLSHSSTASHSLFQTC
ncbi:hypothetical protein GE09DRAFT_488993 [Coniochaeta sp. 2T2.1]|nr:hypothetical protein GE09DRAFT_488993 [Coniochaeta sp. 2T2.1]